MLLEHAETANDTALPVGRCEPERSVNEAAASRPQPYVSVIMPVRNEERYIARSLAAVLAQDYPRERTEIIVADGQSTDKTCEIVRNLQRRWPSITLTDNPGRIVPTGMNAAIRLARGAIIIRIDGHCEVEPDYVRQCVERLEMDEADGVGGPIETVGESYLSEAIAAAMSSPVGVGGSAFRTIRDRPLFVDTVPFPAYKREAIQRNGLYDEELVRNQDDEYNYRLRKFGGRILLAPEIRSRYYSRSSLTRLWRQYYQYGVWKVRVMQKHPRQMRWRQLVPAIFVASLCALAMGALARGFGVAPLAICIALYAAMLFVGAAWTASKSSWRFLPVLPVVFAILHVSYGCGFLAGLVRFRHRWADHTGKVPPWSHPAASAPVRSLAGATQGAMSVPFFRVNLTDEEISEVVTTLQSGWLTSGPRVKKFETEFAAAVGANHAVAVNSCTAALHLALEALGVRPGDAVLVPTLTFAATAEVVRYMGAVPILVDCEPQTLNMDLADAERKLVDYARGKPRSPLTTTGRVVGVIAVHVGGRMMSPLALSAFAKRHGLWLVEDAAHAFPAAWRSDETAPWLRCGDNTAAVTCFSFYANKTITTGEGGMAVTSDGALAERMKLMSLHGLSHDAWHRYSGGQSWDYRIVAPGFKYNLTDMAAALGCIQLERAEKMRARREEIAHRYFEQFADVGEIELPEKPGDCLHAWHLFPVRLHLPRLSIDRAIMIDLLREQGVGSSVHWRPLHLHPYYEQTFGWRSEEFPVASSEWERLISLPLYPSMSDPEIGHVVAMVKTVCRQHTLIK